MRGLVLFSLLTIAMPMAYGHGDADWARGHVGHVKVTKVEGYFIDDSATITVAGKTISGKFSIPMKVYNDGYTDYDDDLSYVWDNSSFPNLFTKILAQMNATVSIQCLMLLAPQRFHLLIKP